MGYTMPMSKTKKMTEDEAYALLRRIRADTGMAIRAISRADADTILEQDEKPELTDKEWNEVCQTYEFRHPLAEMDDDAWDDVRSAVYKIRPEK